jgi:ubiquinone/menaquinone biosynthesis C-methylase UbiE|tara:strand:+ start:430 stop:1044 length:615 start_codon:yes stop_codon:yes gene_type:complete
LSRYNKILNAVPKNAKNIVDIGCGDGILTYLLAKKNHIEEVFGCDTEQTGITLARDKVKDLPQSEKIKYINISFEDCQFPYQSVDVITMCDVIEHIEETGPLLKEIKRVGKKGGVLINTTPLKRNNGVKWDEHHVLEYTKDTLFELLSNYFPETNVTKFSPTFFYKRYHKVKILYNILYLIGLNPLSINLGAIDHTMLFSISYF